MDRVGDQHFRPRGRTDRCEESIRQVSTYTAQEISTLQSRLEKQLGPEYLSSRSGPGGQKVHYVAAEKCIQLANAVFGFNGWSSQIIDFQVDFIDENPQTSKISLGLSVVVRVTLKDGTFHEDIGYGHVENCKSKAAAFEKAKKEGTSDALKRALRNFGNVLGNCIYDKEYLRQVSKVKPFLPKWSEDNLFRHNSFVAPSGPRNKSIVEKEIVDPTKDKVKQNEQSESGLLRAGDISEEFFEEDFGDFDEADFGVTDPDSHPDEVVLSDITPTPITVTSLKNSLKVFSSIDNGEMKNNNTATISDVNIKQTSPVVNGQPVQTQNISSGTEPPKTIYSKTASSGSILGRDSIVPNKVNKQSLGNPTSTSRILNQYNRASSSNRNPMVNSPELLHKFSFESPQENNTLVTPILGSGFYSARAANLVSPISEPENVSLAVIPDLIPPSAPSFNPYAESPSIRKTPGIDHRCSKPLTKDLKHISSSSQGTTTPIAIVSQSSGMLMSRSNIINPSLDSVRRIGAPGNLSPIGMTNSRGMGFKIPMKRNTDGGIGKNNIGVNRIPLETLNANTNGSMIDIVDPKRQKLHS